MTTFPSPHKTICPSCKEDPPDLAYPEPHSTVCASCGLVLDDRAIDSGPEWRTFSTTTTQDSDPTRVGTAHALDSSAGQLETRIASPSRGLQRAQTAQSAQTTQRQLLHAYTEIDSLCENGLLSAGRVSETAKEVFRLIHDADDFRERRRDLLVAGCIFVACRRRNVSRSYIEMCALAGVSRRELGRVVRRVDDFLASQVQQSDQNGGPVSEHDNTLSTTTGTGTRITQLIPRFTSHLDLPYVVTRRATSLAERVAERGILGGRSPLTVSAACIYFCARVLYEEGSVSVGEVAQVVGVSAQTVDGAVRILDAEGLADVDVDGMAS